MSFMEKQVTRKQAWIEVETSHGTEWLDAVSLGLNVRDSQTKTHPLTDKEREEIVSKTVRLLRGNDPRMENHSRLWSPPVCPRIPGLHRMGCLRHTRRGREIPRRNVRRR